MMESEQSPWNGESQVMNISQASVDDVHAQSVRMHQADAENISASDVQLELVEVEKVSDVLLAAGKKIVEANNFMTFGQQSFAQVRTDKPGAAGNEYSHKGFSPPRRRDAE